MSRAVVSKGLMLLAAFACSCLVLAASAFTIEALPGSAPQTTRPGAFFPVDVGVTVRDDAGLPVPGVPVSFYIPYPSAGGAFALILGIDTVNAPVFVTSDEDGVASLPWLFASNTPGEFLMIVSAGGANELTLSFTVTDGLPWSMRNIAGAGQAAPVGTTYPVRWAAQVLGEDHQPVPYACVMFFDGDPSNAGGSFAPTPGYFVVSTDWARVIVKADENGVAVAPPFVANDAAGPHWAAASPMVSNINRQGSVAFESFQYTNTKAQSDR
jgi:hypothetical protein